MEPSLGELSSPREFPFKELPSHQNAFSEVGRRAGEVKEYPVFFPLQAGDQPIGVSEDPVPLRKLAYFLHLHKKKEEAVEVINAGVIAAEERGRLIRHVEELELLMEYTLTTCHLLLHTAQPLRIWTSTPIFTRRENNQVVITANDLRKHDLLMETRPYRPGNNYTWYREIALQSVAGYKPLDEPEEGEV
ncbi:MAG: hypothetical protein ACM3TU_03505 [Bacillota bacterium]